MAKCSRCGKQAGLFANICDECKEVARKEELVRLAEQEEQNRAKGERVERELEAAEERHRALREQLIEKTASEVWSKIEAGQKVFLYDELYLSVDSVVAGEKMSDAFGLGDLRQRGLDGWEVIATVPVTFGLALKNVSAGTTFGETWGVSMRTR